MRWVQAAQAEQKEVQGAPKLRESIRTVLAAPAEKRTKQQDFYHVVSAYEDHEHVYEFARAKPAVVMLRGGGIVSSRILQRLMDDRENLGLSTDSCAS